MLAAGPALGPGARSLEDGYFHLPGRAELALEVQRKVLPQFGFQGSKEGSSDMIRHCSAFLGDKDVAQMFDAINKPLGFRDGAVAVKVSRGLLTGLADLSGGCTLTPIIIKSDRVSVSKENCLPGPPCHCQVPWRVLTLIVISRIKKLLPFCTLEPSRLSSRNLLAPFGVPVLRSHPPGWAPTHPVRSSTKVLRGSRSKPMCLVFFARQRTDRRGLGGVLISCSPAQVAQVGRKFGAVFEVGV
ncbi:unnamed protein product [Effrenium voratum]|nr:unnamed protein product [Effrenium voratum]